MVERPLNVLLIDQDPIFRLGLEAALSQRDELRLCVGFETLTEAIQHMELQRLGGMLPPDVALLNLAALIETLGQEDATAAIAQFQADHPNLPLIGLEHQHPASLSLWSQRQGLAGHWAREQSLDELLQALFLVRRGQRVWTLPEGPRLPMAQPPIPPRLGLWSGTVASGIMQVEQRLSQLDRQREQASWAEKVWLDGARRELRATRWLLGRFSGRASRALSQQGPESWELEVSSSVPLNSQLGGPSAATPSKSGRLGSWLSNRGKGKQTGLASAEAIAATNASQTRLDNLPRSTRPPQPIPSPKQNSSLASTQTTAQTDLQGRNVSPSIIGGEPSLAAYPRANGRELQAMLFAQIGRRLPPGLVNLTGEPQEIDILNQEKRQELLSTVLRCWGDLLTDLRQSNLEKSQFSDRGASLLLDWWSTALGDFLGRYSNLELPDGPVEIMPFLLQEQPNVEAAIFRHIPGVDMLFSTLLFETPVAIDGVDYRPESPEAMTRLELLSENLLIQMCNAVMQPLLNNFADVDVIKQSFYDKRLLSTREIEKFRNNLSWKYRVAAMFQEAQDIYESRYGLLRFSEPLEEGGICGISKASVYAPRRTEMAQLTSFQQVVTLALEVRDAVAPRLEVVTRWAGTVVVYLLTQVVGRGIGLVGRGVVQGVGSSMQDFRKGRRGER